MKETHRRNIILAYGSRKIVYNGKVGMRAGYQSRKWKEHNHRKNRESIPEMGQDYRLSKSILSDIIFPARPLTMPATGDLVTGAASSSF